MRFWVFFLCCTCVCAAVKLDPKQLIELATTTPDSLRDALAFPARKGAKQGTALVEYGPDFLWAIEPNAAAAVRRWRAMADADA